MLDIQIRSTSTGYLAVGLEFPRIAVPGRTPLLAMLAYDERAALWRSWATKFGGGNG